jgi:hypothetical protein
MDLTAAGDNTDDYNTHVDAEVFFFNAQFLLQPHY